MNETINIVVGYDERESVAYHTCVESIIANSTEHVKIIPLCLKHFKKYREEHMMEAMSLFTLDSLRLT